MSQAFTEVVETPSPQDHNNHAHAHSHAHGHPHAHAHASDIHHVNADHHQLQDSGFLPHHAGQLQYLPSDPTAVHTLSHMRDGYHEDSLLTKQLGVDPLPFDMGNTGSPDGSPDRKRRRMNGEQQVKRHKYDVLKSFFRIYFKVDNQSMVLKDAIFNLYSRKIPSDSRIARNAMYRHMWSFFKEDKISAFQSNYREYIKGIKLLTGQEPLAYDGFEKDYEVLQSIGVQNLFDFQEEELAKSSNEAMLASPHQMGLPPASSQSPQDYLKSDGDDDIFRTIESLEMQAKNIISGIKELKAKLVSRKKLT